MFLHESVILFTGGSASGGGVCLQGEWTGPPNRILRDTVNEWAVRILLECIVVNSCRFLSRCLFVVFAMRFITFIPSSFRIQERLLQKLQFKFPLFLKINRHLNLLSIQIQTTTFIQYRENWNVNLHNLDLTDLEMPNLDLYDLDLTDLNPNDLYLFELDPIREYDCLVRLWQFSY